MKNFRLLCLALFLACFPGLFLPLAALADVADDAWAIQPVLPGMKAAPFQATAADGSAWKFDPAGLERPVLFVFYRGGWCPYCNLHLAELRHIEDEIAAAGVDLVFLSADSPKVISEALEDGDAPRYTLLSDAAAEASQAFGIAFEVPDETVTLYRDRGIVDLQPLPGTADVHVLPAPAVFLVAADGTVKFQFVNPDYRVRVSNDVLLAAVRTMPDRVLER